MTESVKFNCAACDAEGNAENVKYVGEIIQCDSCNEELEVASLDPLTVSVAPEAEEDWGE